MTIRPSSGETCLKMSFQKATFSSLSSFYNGLLWIKAVTKFNVIMEGYSKDTRDVDYKDTLNQHHFEIYQG